VGGDWADGIELNGSPLKVINVDRLVREFLRFVERLGDPAAQQDASGRCLAICLIGVVIHSSIS